MSRRYKGGVISATAPTTSTSSATGVWTLPQQMQAQAAGNWPPLPPGSQSYTTAGTFTWVAPAGVTSVSVVAVGSGGAGPFGGSVNGASGGGLGYKNNFSVTPGNSYSVVVGAAGGPTSSGSDSYFVTNNTSNCFPVGKGGTYSSTSLGGLFYGTGGGRGGAGGGYNPCCAGNAGGGGAGGYSGNGGNGAYNCAYNGSPGAGGGGGGGAVGRGGGGVGIFGQGANGGGCFPGGGGGSGGTSSSGQNAGSYGGGGAGHSSATGGVGAVRIVWPGTTRQFPSTNVGAP